MRIKEPSVRNHDQSPCISPATREAGVLHRSVGVSDRFLGRFVGSAHDLDPAERCPLDLDGDGVDLCGRVAGALVDALDRVGVRRLGDAPHHARLRIAPGALEVDILVALDVEVGLVSRLECLGSHAVHPMVNVHELGHRDYASGAESWLAQPQRGRRRVVLHIATTAPALRASALSG